MILMGFTDGKILFDNNGNAIKHNAKDGNGISRLIKNKFELGAFWTRTTSHKI